MNDWALLYKASTKKNWHGRIDSLTNPDSFRWHQSVKDLNLVNPKIHEIEHNKKNFCFLGFVCDEGVNRNLGRVGASKGSAYLRREMSNLAWDSDLNIGLFDAGNIVCKEKKLEEAQHALSEAIFKILSLDLIPVLLGGGHDIAFGHFIGISNYLRSNKLTHKVGIINFDAHFDLRPVQTGIGSSGTMFSQIAEYENNIGSDFNYYCVGIQTYANTKSLFKRADELGVKFELAKNINPSKIDELKDRIGKFIEDQKHIYLTICADVFSSAHAPGVSAPQPFGLHPEIALELIKYVVASGKVISFDLAEIAPRFDEDSRTAKLGAVLIYAIINTMAEIKT